MKSTISNSKICSKNNKIVDYAPGAYTNFLHEERKMRRLFFARRADSTHFTCRVEKIII